LRNPPLDEISETFKHAPKAGYAYWGLAGPITWTPGLIQWLDTEGLQRQAAAAGLKGLTEVYAASISTDSVEAAESCIKDLLLNAQAAVKLKCPLLVFSGGKRQTDGLKNTPAGLDRLAESIADLPVKVALEPHTGSQFQNEADYDEIFDHITTEQIGITIDTGHFHVAGVDWKALIRKYPDRVYNVHVKDHIGSQSVPIGAGEVDMPGLLHELRAINYRGPLAVELEVEDPENLPRYVADAYQYLSGLIQ
jgi:sugar phosphate isomerase/epimerase